MALRKKRKPDFYTLNIVTKSSKKKLAIEKVNVPVQLSSTSTDHEVENAPSPIQPTSVQNITNDDDAVLDWDNPGMSDHCEHFNDVKEHNTDTNDSDEDEENNAGSKLSQHNKRKFKAAKAWKSSRESIYTHVIQSYAPLAATCFLCDKDAKVKCPQCGPTTFYCVQCAQKLHVDQFVFHHLSYGK